MTFEEELEKMQEEALAELDEGQNNDADQNDDQPEEPIDDTIDDREDYEDESGTDEDGDTDEEDDGDEIDGDENDNDEEIDEPVKEEQSFEPVEVTVGGQKITLQSQEEMMKFLQRSAEQLSAQRNKKSINDRVMEQSGLSVEDIQLLVDAKNGNKAAIAKLAKESNVDIYDIDDELADQYQPEFQVQQFTETDQVAEEILAKPELAEKFQTTIKNVPEDFVAKIASSPDNLRNFARHVESGLAEEVIPLVMKEQMISGGDFFDLYARIGREFASKREEQNQEKTKRKVDPKAEELKKRAKLNTGKGKSKRAPTTADDIWNMSDEEFHKKFM